MDSRLPKRLLRLFKFCRFHYLFCIISIFIVIQFTVSKRFFNLGSVVTTDSTHPKQQQYVDYKQVSSSTHFLNHTFPAQESQLTLSLPHYDTKKESVKKLELNVKLNVSKSLQKRVPSCPRYPQHLRGHLSISRGVKTWNDIRQTYPDLVKSGVWSPEHCRPVEKVAIIIPYRNRDFHLRVLINHLHPFLQRQEINYGIFVVEQLPGSLFNRASLFNIGVLESLKVNNYTCFIFHDVDLLPEDDRALYRCSSLPIHLSAAIDKFKYKLPYIDLFGGVSAISRDLFFHVNGFSNLYFGWGGEDDDMSSRLRSHGFSIKRYPLDISRYKMIKHRKESTNRDNPHRFHLLKSAGQRSLNDGVRSTIYHLVSAHPQDTVIWIKVDIPEKKIRKMWASTIPISHENELLLSVILVYIVVASIIGLCMTFFFCST